MKKYKNTDSDYSLFPNLDAEQKSNKVEEALEVIRKKLEGKQTKMQINDINDGRIKSSFLEKKILPFVKEICEGNNLPYEEAKDRDFCDFYLYGKPVNLKVSALDGADNVCGLAGIAYAFTGIKCKKESEAIKILSDFVENNKEGNPESDYYFLIVAKENFLGDIYPIRDVFYTSVKQLANVTPNPSNPPFQCHWNKNRNRVRRTFEEARKFIFPKISESYAKGMAKKINIKELMDECGK